jgi:cell wall assembly regulator SMI1
MLKTLQEISKKALLLNDFDFSEEQTKTKWLGTTGADGKEILDVEQKLKVKLPDDYTEFLKISDGFPQTSSINCSFLSVGKIDYLKTLDEDLVEIWRENEVLKEVGDALASSILIGGLNEEQQFLLIPPNKTKDKWGYWKFASWIPGEEKYPSLKDYFKSDLSFLKQQTKDLKTTKPKFITDYSLRDAVFNLDWETVYSLSSNYIIENKRYGYFNGDSDLFALLLVSAGKTNRFEDLEKLIQTFQLQNLKALNASNFNLNNEHLLNKYGEAAHGRNLFVQDFQMNKFSKKTNPTSLEDIEMQIKQVRKDLLKEKNNSAKLNYQLYFLFEYGSPEDFILLYEQNYSDIFLTAHFKAAIVYSTLNQLSNSKTALKRYFKAAFDYRPFDPFLCESLLPLLDKDLIKSLDN